jgi:hypothetical protein
LGSQEALPRALEIPELLACTGVVNYGADGHLYGKILTILTVPVGAFSVPSRVSPKGAVVPELQQRICVLGAFQGDITTPAAIAPAGSATRNELLTPECNTTIPALATGNMDLGFVNKHVESQSAG